MDLNGTNADDMIRLEINLRSCEQALNCTFERLN